MNTSPKKHDRFPTEVYHQTSSDLMALKSVLPQEAVVSLAREVLSRLAQRAGPVTRRSEAVIALSEALIADETPAAAKLIEGHYEDGLTVEALYLSFLAPSARQLGEWWNDDRITFADVTVGIGRIYGIMRSIGRRMPRPAAPDRKAALVACVPGETHTLGAKMATELLRGQGWTIDMELSMDHDDLVAKIVDSGHVVIAFSAGGEHALPALAKLIMAVRVNQPHAAILVSGNVVEEAGDRIALMDVEGMSKSFAEASGMLDDMWESVAARTD